MPSNIVTLEKHAFLVVVEATLLVVFWFGVWSLLDEASEKLQERYGVKRVHVAAGAVLLVLLAVAVFPATLAKF